MTKLNTNKLDQSEIAGSNLLSAAYLLGKGFKLIEGRTFENYNLPYYAREGVVLFFNTPVTEWNKNDFLVGFAEQKGQKQYTAVTFRWITEKKEVVDIYKSITGKDLSENGLFLSFEQCLREEFLMNTQNYPQEYHKLFSQKFNRAKSRHEERLINDL